jgi:Cu/Ag efflux protein CusF
MNLQKVMKIIILFVLTAFALSACNSGNQGENAEKQKYKSIGVVKAIDAEKSEITIDHEDIPGFMSAMEMDYSVSDRKLLESVKTDDKVEFDIEQKGSEIFLTKINKTGEVAKQINASEIYKANCAKCHGENGEGIKGKGISFLKGHALHHPEEDFIKQVENGEENKMPAFKDKLSEDEIAAVVKYVREEIQNTADKKEDKSHKH